MTKHAIVAAGGQTVENPGYNEDSRTRLLPVASTSNVRGPRRILKDLGTTANSLQA